MTEEPRPACPDCGKPLLPRHATLTGLLYLQCPDGHLHYGEVVWDEKCSTPKCDGTPPLGMRMCRRCATRWAAYRARRLLKSLTR